jgi:hypothetical protein
VRPAVVPVFFPVTDRLEGKCAWLYLDVLGLVTTGRGNLVDPLPAALSLPWMHADLVTPATAHEVISEWQLVKSLQSMAARGGMAFASVTILRLTDAAIDTLCMARLTGNAAALAERFPAFETWQADAQFGALLMAWAMGSGFPAKFPKFTAAALAGDFATCAAQCRISNATADRNAAIQTCFLNAANPAADPATLYYPSSP